METEYIIITDTEDSCYGKVGEVFYKKTETGRPPVYYFKLKGKLCDSGSNRFIQNTDPGEEIVRIMGALSGDENKYRLLTKEEVIEFLSTVPGTET